MNPPVSADEWGKWEWLAGGLRLISFREIRTDCLTENREIETWDFLNGGGDLPLTRVSFIGRMVALSGQKMSLTERTKYR